jgi:hypothetical protein
MVRALQYLHAGRVSAHYFDVLALHPLIGRSFSEDEGRPTALRRVRHFALVEDVPIQPNSRNFGDRKCVPKEGVLRWQGFLSKVFSTSCSTATPVTTAPS